jgi:hypothetical protein
VYKKSLPMKLKLSLVPICIGVGLATANDFSFNMVRLGVHTAQGPHGVPIRYVYVFV